MTTAQPSDATTTAPPLDGDAAKYAELAKELGIEEQEGGEPASAEPAERAEPADPPAEPADKDPKPQPTELDNLRTALRESREAHRTEQARTDAILAALQQARERRSQQEPGPAKTEPPELPDVQEDPIGHFTGRIAQLEERLRQASQGGQQDNQQIKQHLQEQAMWATVEASERDIRSQKPDYDDACRHLETSRVRQLDRMYPSNSPQAVALARQHGFANANEYKLSLLDQDRRNVATHALQTGISPAQLYYDLALDSGYQPKANSKAPEVSLAERAAQQIAAARKGAKASVTLSGDSGRKGAKDMSISDLADLFVEDPDAADKVWEQMARAGKLG